MCVCVCVSGVCVSVVCNLKNHLTINEIGNESNNYGELDKTGIKRSFNYK